MGKRKHLPIKADDQFFEFTVIDPNQRIQGGNRTDAAALVQCSCSTPGKPVEKIVRHQHLRSGNTKSCGHYHSDEVSNRMTTHRLSNHPLYSTWYKMLS